MYPAFESITRLSLFCKHRGFEEEQEVRIVITEPSTEMGQDPEKPDDKPYRRTHSYLRNGAVVPCVHLFEDQKLKTLLIRRIIVGPHPDKPERKKAVEIYCMSNVSMQRSPCRKPHFVADRSRIGSTTAANTTDTLCFGELGPQRPAWFSGEPAGFLVLARGGV